MVTDVFVYLRVQELVSKTALMRQEHPQGDTSFSLSQIWLSCGFIEADDNLWFSPFRQNRGDVLVEMQKTLFNTL